MPVEPVEFLCYLKDVVTRIDIINQDQIQVTVFFLIKKGAFVAEEFDKIAVSVNVGF